MDEDYSQINLARRGNLSYTFLFRSLGIPDFTCEAYNAIHATRLFILAHPHVRHFQCHQGQEVEPL